MMAPTKTKLSKMTTTTTTAAAGGTGTGGTTKEYVGFTPSGKGVRVAAGKGREVYAGKGEGESCEVVCLVALCWGIIIYSIQMRNRYGVL